MKLRFEVNQAEAFRRGINLEKSIHVLDVDPSKLDQATRNLIADRLRGIDVCKLSTSHENGKLVPWLTYGKIMAMEPTFACLLEAIKENEAEVQSEIVHEMTKLQEAQLKEDNTVDESKERPAAAEKGSGIKHISYYQKMDQKKAQSAS